MQIRPASDIDAWFIVPSILYIGSATILVVFGRLGIPVFLAFWSFQLSGHSSCSVVLAVLPHSGHHF
jgi:hypothetical protein